MNAFSGPFVCFSVKMELFEYDIFVLKYNALFFFFLGNNNASGVVIDDKSKQWFGASVHSSGPDGIIVVSFKL